MKRRSRVYLIRHGQINGYENFPIYGHTDVALTPIGILQMESMAERLRLVDLSAIFSSDLERCVNGAKIIARHHDVPYHFLPELREMYFGDWEGLTLSDVQENFPKETEKRKRSLLTYQIPGEGETIERFSKRIMTCFDRILEEQDGKDFLIVAHSGVNRVILCHALGLDLVRMFDLQQDYGCLNIVDYTEASCLVRLVNG